MGEKRWEIKTYDNKLAREIELALGISHITAKILVNRGIKTVQEAQNFFQIELTNLLDPFMLSGMEEGIKRLIDGLQNNEKIIIYGDYDVDGITGTSVLLQVLRNFSKNVDYYIPHRLEGYGLNKDAIQRLGNAGYTLIVTVDNGISCYEEVELAKSLGIDIIITDHHEPPGIIPQAVAVINPKLSNCNYPCPYLSGVGVGFKFCQALYYMTGLDMSHLYQQLDLVALGTVADIVPLMGENRVIVANGLTKIEKTLNLGLQELIKVSGLMDKSINAGHLGYVLGPRINAIGRLGDPMLGVELFITDDKERASELARQLDQANRKRQMIEESIFNRAVEIIEEKGYASGYGIILASDEWHPGVIGIVASKLVEKYYRPTILISIKDGVGKGSARGIRGLNIYEALTNCQEFLLGYGGHELAAGLSIIEEKVEDFRTAFEKYIEKSLSPEDLVPSLNIDLEVCLEELDFRLLDELESLEPHGPGNPRPKFVIRKLSHESRIVGKAGDHLKIKVSNGLKKVDGIGFGMAYMMQMLEGASKIDLVCNLNRNIWQEKEYLQMMLLDLLPTKLSFAEEIFEKEVKILHTKEDSPGDYEKNKSLIETINVEEYNSTELSQKIGCYFGIVNDSSSRVQEEVYKSLLKNINTLVFSAREQDVLPGILSFASFQSILDNGITCILYPSKSSLEDNFKIIKRLINNIGLTVMEISGPLYFEDDDSSNIKDLKVPEVNIVLTTPHYFNVYLDFCKNVEADTKFIVIPEVQKYVPGEVSGLTLTSLTEKLSFPVMLLYTPCGEEDFKNIGENLFPALNTLKGTGNKKNLKISDRRNLGTKEENLRDEYLRELTLKGEKTVIFVNTPESSVELAQKLRILVPEMDQRIIFYHHKMPIKDCVKIQELFKNGDLTTIVATDCFREGFSIPDIRHVVHYELSFTLADFRERSLMAGNDGKESLIHLLYGENEYKLNNQLLDGRIPDRNLLIEIYICLQKLADGKGLISHSPLKLLREIQKKGNTAYNNLDPKAVIESLCIFHELELIKFWGNGDSLEQKNVIRLLPKPPQKLDLKSSIRYNECNTERKKLIAFSEMARKEKAEFLLKLINQAEYSA